METPEQTSESGGQLTTALRAQKRRIVAALADDETLDATPIVRGDETLCCEEYLTLVYELHHVQLPELARNGVIRFDRRRDVVTRGPRFDEIAAPDGERDGGDEIGACE